MCNCTLFEEDSFIRKYLVALLLLMLASRFLWYNVFLGNAENYVVNWTEYSVFCCLRLISQIAQLGLISVGMC